MLQAGDFTTALCEPRFPLWSNSRDPSRFADSVLPSPTAIGPLFRWIDGGFDVGRKASDLYRPRVGGIEAGWKRRWCHQSRKRSRQRKCLSLTLLDGAFSGTWLVGSTGGATSCWLVGESKSPSLTLLACCAFRYAARRKCWWSNELMACLRMRRIPRSRFGFPLFSHALELIGLGDA